MNGDRTRMWRADGIPGLDLLEASFGRQSCPRHSHDTYGIGVVHGGANRFHYRGGFHVAPVGSVCTVTVDEVHAGEVLEDGLTYRCLYPTPGLVTAIARHLRHRAEDRIYELPAVIDDPAAAGLIDRLFEAETAGAGLLARQSLLAVLLARVLVRHAVERMVSDRRPAADAAIRRARDFLHDDPARPVSLEQLAIVAGTGPFRLIRGFKRLYGLPPHAYQTQLRVRRAKALIAQGHGLAEAALAAGFADQSHLTRHFKRILGVSPGRYRQSAGFTPPAAFGAGGRGAGDRRPESEPRG